MKPSGSVIVADIFSCHTGVIGQEGDVSFHVVTVFPGASLRLSVDLK